MFEQLLVQGGDSHGQIPDGMEIFKSWGNHIKKFAMSFEIDQGKRGSFQMFSCLPFQVRHSVHTLIQCRDPGTAPTERPLSESRDVLGPV